MDAQQNYFNELAEKMMKNEITTEQACSLFKDFCDEGNAEEMEMLECCLDSAEKEIEELKETKEKLEGLLTMLNGFNTKLKEENEGLKNENEALILKMTKKGKKRTVKVEWTFMGRTGSSAYLMDSEGK
jgi:regulator of sirC expression with transglutaminase-like and TPR domain